MRKSRRTEKLAALEQAIKGDIAPLQRLQQENKTWIFVDFTMEIDYPEAMLEEKRPEDWLTEIEVDYPGPGGGHKVKHPDMTRAELDIICQELGTKYHLFRTQGTRLKGESRA